MNTITLRTYQPSDYPSVKQNLIDGGLYTEDMDTEERLAAKIKRNPDSIIVAETDGRVIGNIFFVEDGWAPLFFRLAVAKDFRGKGVGTKLLKEAELRIKVRGYSTCFFLVDNEKKELHTFYKKRGYSAGEVFKIFYKNLT